MPICELCKDPSKPLKNGRAHYECKLQASMKLSQRSNHEEFLFRLSRVERAVDKNLTAKAKVWNEAMGREALLAMFPDMEGRV